MTQTPPLKCFSPLRIRNKYTGDWMFVPCRQCDVCLINQANTKAYHLAEEFKKYPFIQFVTLTYDNEHLPYMMVDDCRVFRGCFPPNILGYLGFVNHTVKVPNNFHTINSLGVLYKKDLQDFFKRLRINYERENKSRFPWRYSAVGEYGSVGKRPHYHIAFFGYESFPDRFRDTVIKSWKLCDWSRFDLDEVFEISTVGISNYLASYINSYINLHDVFSEKDVKPFTVRSKDIHFAVDNEISENFKSTVKKGLLFDDFQRNGNPFEYVYKGNINRLSVKLLPKKYLSSVFSFPAGLRKSDFVSKFRSCSSVLQRRCYEKLENSDYSFYLSFNKYCKLKQMPLNYCALLTYIDDASRFINLYESTLIKQSMLEYDKNSPASYFATRINTCVDDLDKRAFRLLLRGVKQARHDYIQPSGSYFKEYIFNYGKKLISKHLNDYV